MYEMSLCCLGKNLFCLPLQLACSVQWSLWAFVCISVLGVFVVWCFLFMFFNGFIVLLPVPVCWSFWVLFSFRGVYLRIVLIWWMHPIGMTIPFPCCCPVRDAITLMYVSVFSHR